MISLFNHVVLPVPRGPNRKKLLLGIFRNLGIINSILSPFLEFLPPKYYHKIMTLSNAIDTRGNIGLFVLRDRNY